MSAIRTYSPEGRPQWTRIDDGASPSRHNRGIRGASFENPIQVSRVVTETERDRANRQTRESKARKAAR